MASHIFIRAHKNASSFRLTKSEISSGHVRNYFNCPLCDYILLNPVDGFVEGKKLNSSKWLIDAQIILATRLYSKITDTVKVRQIFIRKNSN
ncbi:MAG: hypothetical protein INR69_21865 [Mucilaginibacter polytrichastri]|nr:hypothetical protein [Mucilaginibacter polytrichastri]